MAWCFLSIFILGFEANLARITPTLDQLQGAIVFESERSPGNMEIMITRAPDWKPSRLTDSPGFDGHPSWSPDGKRIVFTCVRTGNKDLFLINPDGTGLTQITSTPEDEDYARWLPDGSRIGFCHRNQIWTMKTDGTDRRQVTTIGVNESICWSPDGKKLLFASRRLGRNYELYVRDLQTNREQRLTDKHEAHGFWSPDGSRIAFSSKRDGDWNVYVMNADGSVIRRVTKNPGHDWMAGWSGDGNRLLIASEVASQWNVYVVNTDGSQRLPVTQFAEVTRYPSWWTGKKPGK